jgi:uncharacterized protein (TIGR03435 family)
LYALTLARKDRKTGSGLRVSGSDCAALTLPTGLPPAPALPAEDPNKPDARRVECPSLFGPGYISARRITMDRLATALTSWAGRTVSDRSNLPGEFDVDLTWTPEQTTGFNRSPIQPGVPTDGPSIFTAVTEQLGLKLESTKGPVQVLVIDHVERPSEN